MKTKLFITIWIGTLLLISCAPLNLSAPTPDVGFIKTAAAQTVVANFTLTAESAAATSTPTSALLSTPTLLPNFTTTPTLTPTPAAHPGAAPIVLCNEYSWDDTTVDVNVPDNTQMTAGQSFVKTWKVKNSGTCTWGAGYQIIFSSGTNMSGQPQSLPIPVTPGQEIEISVNFIAPNQPGSYSSAWTLDSGGDTVLTHFFGSDIQGLYHAKPLYVKIIVK
ncbi:MAG TPA: NBR1-Ig-like domain-containing protein [Anaerolineales bacterium]|nr:NBR1-Ig-like domain-containing protein [Anaerolineales bacterium]